MAKPTSRRFAQILTFSMLLLQVLQIEAATATTPSSINEDLDFMLKQNNKSLVTTNETLVKPSGSTINEEEPTETQFRSAGSNKPTRGGRMLNLDVLAGDIGKEEVLAKERSLSGQRQSRTLSKDLIPSTSGQAKIDGRTKKSSKSKKMEIKGFIPIVSIDNAKSGKLFDNPNESGSETDDEDDVTNNDDQTMSQIAHQQTSIGHASFAPQQNEQQPQGSSQWQQVPPKFQDLQEIGRANRGLLGSNGILNGLATQKRFVSSLVSQPQFGMPQNQLQAPVNQFQMIPQSEDCICVPFFQCKNGYLTESQLSRGQVQQLMQQNNPSYPYSVPQSNQYQTPRALSNPNQQQLQQQQSSNDLNYMTNQPISSLMSQIEPQISQASLNKAVFQQGDQKFVDDIYDQLRKNIENDKLEQQLILQQQQQQHKQQPQFYLPLDERSKGGLRSEEASRNQSSSQQESEELLERSLLKPLNLNFNRRASSQTRCGIMRTCCKIPPSLLVQQHNPQGAFGGRGQHTARLNGLSSSLPVINYNQRPPVQPQYQILRPNSQTSQAQPLIEPNLNQHNQFSHNEYQASNSALSNLIEPNVATQFEQNQYQPQPSTIASQIHQSRPIGTFMTGKCGGRQTLGISGRVQNAQPQPGSESTAEFGEFPAHVAILKRISPGDSLFVCSATLISNQWVATAAHCVRKHRPEELKVRLGEWDVNRDDEFYPFVESNVREIIINPDFQASSLINDIALMRMEITIDAQQMPHISPSCLATPGESFDGQRCWLTGWGKDAFGQAGSFQSVLKKVDLPIVSRQDCELALRYQTKLGKFFRLHSSAICAGGERGKDACEGDGGAGLYCQDLESGLIKVAGLVSWGVGCGQKGVPGIYTNLANFYNWIENVVAASGEENLYQDRNGLPENLFKNVISERSNAGLNMTVLATAQNSTVEQSTGDKIDKQISQTN